MYDDLVSLLGGFLHYTHLVETYGGPDPSYEGVKERCRHIPPLPLLRGCLAGLGGHHKLGEVVHCGERDEAHSDDEVVVAGVRLTLRRHVVNFQY